MREGLVVCREDPVPVEVDGKAVVLRPNRQCVPDIGSYVYIDTDDFLREAIPYQQKQRSVSEGIDRDKVVVLRRNHSQCEASTSARCAGHCLETQGEIAVLQRS